MYSSPVSLWFPVPIQFYPLCVRSLLTPPLVLPADVIVTISCSHLVLPSECPLPSHAASRLARRCTRHHFPAATSLPDACRILAGPSSLRGRGTSCRHRGTTRCLCHTCLSALAAT
jgi:hypothetical protein